MVIWHCPGHAQRPPLPALATQGRARPSSLQVRVEDLQEGGEGENRGPPHPPPPPSPPSPSPTTLSLERTVQGATLLPPAPSQFSAGKGGLKARSGGCGWFGRGKGESPQTEGETPASGNLPEGSLFSLVALGCVVVKLIPQLSLNLRPTMNKFFM